ncbi:hypothetical protein P5V15_004102, partial [Pogonomyrmex californicus]
PRLTVKDIQKLKKPVIYKCTTCGKGYQLETSLRRHRRLECGVEPKHECLLCSLLAQMLMSQDNNEWSQRGANESPYKIPRVSRKRGTSDAKYECNRCGKTYKATTSLSRHKRLECGVMPCEICPICGHPALMNEFNELKPNINNLYDASRYSLNRLVTSPQEQCYFCGECGKGYKWMDNLRRHQRLECGSDELCDWLMEPFVKQDLDEGCLEFVATDYLSPDRLEGRKRRSQILPLVCETCGKNFSRIDMIFISAINFFQEYPLNYPKIRNENEQCTAEKSNDEEPEVCEVPFHGQLNYLLCDSPILNSVEANVVQKNAKSCQQFRCDGCGRAYTRVDSLKRHQQKCDEFLASFQDRQETLERLQQQEYYCNQCGKTYRRLDTLRRHQRQVCGDKDRADQPEEYDALWMLERKARSIGQECQESLPFPSKSYSQSKVHDTLNPGDYSLTQVYGGDSYTPMMQTHYLCTDCGKRYKWLDSLKRHQRVDCGNKEKKFSCHACDRKFKYRYELRNHITAYHDG